MSSVGFTKESPENLFNHASYRLICVYIFFNQSCVLNMKWQVLILCHIDLTHTIVLIVSAYNRPEEKRGFQFYSLASIEYIIYINMFLPMPCRMIKIFLFSSLPKNSVDCLLQVWFTCSSMLPMKPCKYQNNTLYT